MYLPAAECNNVSLWSLHAGAQHSLAARFEVALHRKPSEFVVDHSFRSGFRSSAKQLRGNAGVSGGDAEQTHKTRTLASCAAVASRTSSAAAAPGRTPPPARPSPRSLRAARREREGGAHASARNQNSTHRGPCGAAAWSRARPARAACRCTPRTRRCAAPRRAAWPPRGAAPQAPAPGTTRAAASARRGASQHDAACICVTPLAGGLSVPPVVRSMRRMRCSSCAAQKPSAQSCSACAAVLAAM
jgi:hypothetical protein